MHLMVLLGDVGEVEAHFSLFGDSVNLDVRLVHGLCQNAPQAQKSIWMHPMVLQRDVGQVEPRFSPFGDSVNLNAR